MIWANAYASQVPPDSAKTRARTTVSKDVSLDHTAHKASEELKLSTSFSRWKEPGS